jgi:NADPH:quinone reductase-like Zn-dependent oxidoreductase
MRAARIHNAGSAVVIEDIAQPRPRPDEVLIAVHATGLTAGELTWPQTWPAIPGHEISGTVAALGAGVRGFAAGQEVYGLLGFDREGGAAEFVTAPASDLAFKPSGTDHPGAASLALAALTAWQALQRAHVHAGQHVLVNGGAGGVGNYAVQLAAALGARVTATAAERDAAFVAGLGAGQVIDYSRPETSATVLAADVVVDTVGGAAQSWCWAALRPGGILVSVATAPLEAQARQHHATGIYFIVNPDRAGLAQLAQLTDTGVLRPVVGRALPLEDAPEAFEILQTQHFRGKLVLSVRSGT